MIKNKYTYLFIFSIIYLLGIIICSIFQNVFYILILNGFFMICQTWIIFFLLNKSEKHVNHTHIIKEDNTSDIEVEKEKDFISDTSHKNIPDETDIVYIGEEISLDDIKKMKEENQSWYSKLHQNINKSIFELNNIINGEENNG